MQLVTEKFVWHSMKKDITAWSRVCVHCQRSKIHRHTKSSLGHFPQPTRRFGHIHVDVVGPLPSSEGKRYLFTIIDRSTRWPEAVPMEEASTMSCATALLNAWVSRFGLPEQMTSDRGSVFTSDIWSSLAKLLGVNLHYTTAYHPQANGMVERFHRTLKASLTAICSSYDWHSQLPWVLLGLRTMPKDGLTHSAAEMVYGQPLVVPGEFFPYDPISVLSFFSKVFEKIVYNHVLDFIDDNNVLYDYQYGFRHSHSTQQAIITLVDRITKSLDKGHIAITILLDLKKAFDTVDHRILLRKLYAYGIRGALLKWFESYLTGRTQYVAFNGTNSDIHYVKCGVPQGSILGPLLFILYMNDICSVSKLLFTLLYADDTCVMLSGKDLNDLIAVLNVELISLCDWLKSNKLSLNTQKTFFMVFHRARLKSVNCNDLVIDNASITRVYSAKYLGIIIDVKFNWIVHITYIKNKISKAIGIMYKARQYLNKSSLVNLYYSYVYPYLTYCIEVWGCAYPTHLQCLFLLQKKIIRIITFSHYLAHTEPLFMSLEILPLEKIFYHRCGLMMYKYHNNLLPCSISQLYAKNDSIHDHNTRCSNLLRVPIGSKSFTSVSARIWNVLNNIIVFDVPISKFKSLLKQYLLYNSLTLTYSK